MKKLLIIISSALAIIITGSFLFYNSLYNKQINYIVKLLNRQVQIVGSSVDNTNNGFVSDLNQIVFTEDISHFFSGQEQRYKTVDRMKLFFSKYEYLATGIRYYDNNRNEFTLKKDETGTSWLDQTFILHVQGDILSKDTLVQTNRTFEYYLPVIKNNVPIGNMVVSIDFQKYFSDIFTAFSFQDYQWQWVVSDSGHVIYSNSEQKLNYSKLRDVSAIMGKGATGSLVHRAEGNGRSREIISSVYSTQLLQKNIGLVFSTPTDMLQRYIIRNSLLMGLGTLLVMAVLIYFFMKYIKAQNSEIDRLGASEKILFQMIEEMPVGIIIHNRNREILKANKVAAAQYSYLNEEDMKGKIFPETAVTDENNYFSKNLGESFSPDQFVILKKEIGDVILFRTSIPIRYQGEDAGMEMLIDVTMLESARKQEASASSAKSEFLARMSYELRTPLNGIIGMTDILEKQYLSSESKNVVGLLRRSAEVLLSIINDVLDFTKIESGKMILDEIPFSLREEILYCYDLARTNIDETDVRLTCHVDENVPDNVIGDPTRIRQIITNLLNNSVENTRKGEIHLNCTLKEKNNDGIKLRFELSDNGKSFDKATLKKIFGDYVNIESKVHQDDDNSGFGTILARQIIELMNGEFSAVSPSGLSGNLGTKIEFSISLHSNEKRNKNLHFNEIKSFSGIKTLVITGSQSRDEEILGTLHKMGLALNVTSYQKSTVNQIKASLNFPESRYYFIVIIDDSEFDGFVPAREIQECGLSDKFIILMISSDDEKGNFLKCLTMGIDNYIVKPYEIEELFNTINSSFPQAAGNRPAEIAETRTRDLHILIVEDNKMNQKVIGTMLKSLGYSFDFADDGFAGFIQAKTRRYDVIFMDLLMPGMDGFESARKILEYNSDLLIVAFTADNMPESKRKAEMSGIREFIPKPIRIDDLKKFFSKHFSKN
jgi:signal transduction histidine kinase/CheY-like chemotaxis protein/uncharacterized protein YxeA